MLDHFDIIARVYDRLIGPPNSRRLKQLLHLPATGWLLDGGGGTGRVASHLISPAGRVVICDSSHQMLKKASDKQLYPVRTHVEELPFGDECFDRILVVDALHHFCNQHAAIGELVRVLRCDGRLVIEEPDFNHKGIKVLALIEKLLLMRSHFHTPQEIRVMIESYGCSAVIEHDGRHTAWIVADK